MNENEKKFNQELFNLMPSRMYHGSIGKKYTKENFLNNILIFDNVDELNNFTKQSMLDKYSIRKIIGRTNLDAAYNGIYFTPCKEKAIEWATRAPNKPGQVIVVEIDKQLLLEANILILCLPNSEWARFIVRNRKISTLENICKCSYTMLLDGKIKDGKLFKDIQECNLPYVGDIIHKMRFEFNRQYIFSNLEWNIDKLKKNNDFMSGKYFQLCISSMDLLKSIKVIDIINLEKEDSNDK